MTRRHLDAYYTPAAQTLALLKLHDVTGSILEPCVGGGDIARQLPGDVRTNDIDPNVTADQHLDAASPSFWAGLGDADWIVSNPPYAQPACRDIVRCAVAHARVGVAMLLRLSFLEPTAKINPRGPWLAECPPSRLIVLPRCSYTGDGKTDSVTTAWMIWLRCGPLPGEPPIVCVPRLI